MPVYLGSSQTDQSVCTKKLFIYYSLWSVPGNVYRLELSHHVLPGTEWLVSLHLARIYICVAKIQVSLFIARKYKLIIKIARWPCDITSLKNCFALFLSVFLFCCTRRESFPGYYWWRRCYILSLIFLYSLYMWKKTLPLLILIVFMIQIQSIMSMNKTIPTVSCNEVCLPLIIINGKSVKDIKILWIPTEPYLWHCIHGCMKMRRSEIGWTHCHCSWTYNLWFSFLIWLNYPSLELFLLLTMTYFCIKTI